MAYKKLTGSLVLLLAACGGGEDDAAAALVAQAAIDAAQNAGQEMQVEEPGIAFDTAAARGERPLLREVYRWQGAARDPFRPLITVSDAGGPELPDMLLSTVLYNQSDPSRSVAIFRETGNDQRHTVSPGDRIGRLYVASIAPNQVILTMNDFGTVRRQTYQLRRPGTQ